MRLDVTVGGRSRTVTVERAAGDGRLYRVTIDGATRLVDVCRLDATTLSLVFADEAIPSSHEVTVAGNGRGGALAVGLRGAVVELLVNGGRLRQGAGRAPAVGTGVVKAPMPGRIVRVLVSPGDEVAVRQPLVVVEAMKMENALIAPIAGRVTDVPVEAGEAVETGRVVARIEERVGGTGRTSDGDA